MTQELQPKEGQDKENLYDSFVKNDFLVVPCYCVFRDSRGYPTKELKYPELEGEKQQIIHEWDELNVTSIILFISSFVCFCLTFEYY